MKHRGRWMHGHERAVAAVAVVAAGAVALVVGSMSDERQRNQAAIGSSVTTEPNLPAVQRTLGGGVRSAGTGSVCGAGTTCST